MTAKRTTIKSCRFNLSKGFTTLTAQTDAAENSFSPEDWARCLADPMQLLASCDMTFRPDRVIVKTLDIADTQKKVVVKCHSTENSLRGFFRSLRSVKAFRNFAVAVSLLEHNIPVAFPLAALQRRGFLRTTEFYITEYYDNCGNIHDFIRQHLRNLGPQLPPFKRQAASQLAAIMASLDKAHFWHRDAKATNFILLKPQNHQYRIMLVDMDGIKRYFIRRTASRIRSLARLAASVIAVPGINSTDFLRMFLIYCDLTGIKKSRRSRIFRKIAKLALKKWKKLASQNRY
ncbi:MAG: lipopolysaccharide kinase InaA family protein [Planctomycetota bacterium]